MAKKQPTQPELFPQDPADAPDEDHVTERTSALPRLSRRVYPPFTEEQKRRICELYPGLSARLIAQDVGGSRKMVDAVLQDAGLLARQNGVTNREKRTAARRQQSSTWREQGLCYRCGDAVVPERDVCQRHLRGSGPSLKSGARPCTGCKGPTEKGRGRCHACLERFRLTDKRRREKCLDQNICYKCRKAPRVPSLRSCRACADRAATKARELRHKRASAGLCTYCGETSPLPTCNCCYTCLFKRLSREHFGNGSEGKALQSIWEKQGGVCPYSGLQLTLGVDAQLDHRVPLTRGGEHSIANLQWVHQMVNQMKWNYTEEEFLEMVRRIAQHHPK